MAENIGNYKCEWREVVYDEELQKGFQQYVNTTETQNTEQIEYIDMRKQRHPNTYDKPDIEGPPLYTKESASEDWAWVPAGMASDYPADGGLAVKHGFVDVAVFHLPGRPMEDGRWLCVQNLCPFKQARVMSRGLVAVRPNGQLTVADPIYKTIFDLRTGQGVSHPKLNLSTFQVKVDGSGQVLVRLPSAEDMAAAFERQSSETATTLSFKPPPRGSHPDITVPRKSEASALDW
jgi:nitrite reductase/ring-hydroxylating ferredoxin subunit